MVTWSAPEKSGGEIKTYQVQATNTQTGKKVAIETLETTTRLFEMDPSTKYSITVTTENEQLDGHGGGVGPGVTAEVTTLPLDNKYSLNMQVTATSSESILVNWKQPSAYVGQDIQDYLVHLSMSSVLLQRSLPPDMTTYTFNHLPPFTNATVAVQLRLCGTSTSSEYDAMSVTTWPTEGQEVENLRLTANEPRSIDVNWEPPTSPQGIIRNYKVLVVNKVTGANIERPTDVRAIAITSDSVRLTWRAPAYKLSDESGYNLLIAGPDFSKSAVVGKETLTHKFSGLQPSTDYTVYVQVSDSVVGQQRPMGSSLVKTKSAGSVNGLSAYATATGSDAVSVSWKRLQNYRVEDIRHYAVRIFGPSINAQQLVKADGKTCTFSDLPPFTNFTVLVQIIFKDDSWPPDSAEASVTTWPTVGQKVENLGLTVNEPRSIHVNWEPPTSPQGIIHNYKVLVKNTGSGASQKHVFSEPGQRLVNLDPSTTYIISVAVRNYPLEGSGGGYGVEVSDEATTLSLDIERPTDVRAIAINSDSVRLMESTCLQIIGWKWLQSTHCWSRLQQKRRSWEGNTDAQILWPAAINGLHRIRAGQ
nr:unnamed protein product [Spirometra erinaceieuropaei]